MTQNQTVLAVSAHPDDEVLGAGGTLAKHAAEGDSVHLLFITDGASAQYEDEAMVEDREQAGRRCADRLGAESVHFNGFPNIQLDAIPHIETNVVIEEQISELEPDIVYTHTPSDVNVDHRAVFESTLVAARPHSGVERILAYEVPSATEWHPEPFAPNVYVDIAEYLDTKVEAFLEYDAEVCEYPHPRSERAIRARAHTRGTEAMVEAAEAFRLVREYR